jgi:hypothetical protein
MFSLPNHPGGVVFDHRNSASSFSGVSLRGETKGSKLRAKWGSNGIAVTG